MLVPTPDGRFVRTIYETLSIDQDLVSHIYYQYDLEHQSILYLTQGDAVFNCNYKRLDNEKVGQFVGVTTLRQVATITITLAQMVYQVVTRGGMVSYTLYKQLVNQDQAQGIVEEP